MKQVYDAIRHMTAYRMAWIVVACFFAEAAFLVTQIVLTLLFLPRRYSLSEMLAAHNPLYALPPYFFVIGVIFLATVLYGELQRIRTPLYYIGCGLVTAIVFHEILFIFNQIVAQASDVVINLLSAVVSGFVYWALSLRREL